MSEDMSTDPATFKWQLRKQDVAAQRGMDGQTDALLYGLRAELNVWHSDQGKDEQRAYRLRIDPRCLVIEAARGGPTRPHVQHVDTCTCGMF